MFRQPGGMDEDWYAVPGWTVAHQGIPRVPYAPSREPDRAFYRADEVLFALPPGYFYWQAPFFLVLPAGYGTARLASAVAGLAAVGLVYQLGRAFYGHCSAGLWAAGLYSFSRVFFFPAQTARPDMLCAALGLGAVLATWHWHSSGRWGCLWGAGGLLGLAALTHPFALVFALQLGVWVLVAGRGFRGRMAAGAILAGCTLAVLALWLPLVAGHPEVFRVQFGNNVLDRAGPGLVSRLLFPWPALAYQAKILVEHAQGSQVALMLFGLAGVTLIDLRRQSGPRTAWVLAWSSIYLLAACQGIHPTKGYWCYPGALMFLCLGRVIAVAVEGASHRLPRPVAVAGAAALAFLTLLPGSGIRTWVAHLRHWSEIDYNAPRFARRLLRDLPVDARLTVDPGYVLDAFLAGRPTTLGVTDRLFLESTHFPYDYLIAGRYGMDNDFAEQFDAELVRAYGDRDDIFACYAEIYRPRSRPDGGEPPARPSEPVGVPP